MIHVVIDETPDPIDRVTVDVSLPAGRFMLAPRLGPTAVLLAEYLYLRGDHSYDCNDLAAALGVNTTVLGRTLSRLERFHALTFESADVIKVRRHVRLPKSQQVTS